jgi:hypothetical protein
MIVDSGAYSAWRLGQHVNLDEYCEYIKANQDWIEAYVNLDVIIPKDPARAAKEGYENFLYMRSKGLDPMPVVHAREDVSWVSRYLDAGVKYLGLSASSLRHNIGGEADAWYAAVWAHLVDSEGLPIVRTHAFGEGREYGMRNWPWYYCDSASWLYGAQRGGTFRLPGREGQFALRNDAGSSASMPDPTRLEGFDVAAFDDFVQRIGLSAQLFAEARESAVYNDLGNRIRNRPAYMLRSYCTCLYYLEVEQRVSALQPIKRPYRGLLPIPRPSYPGLEVKDGFRCHLVGGGNAAALVVLAYTGAKHALASFVHVKHFPQYRNIGEFVYDPMGFAQRDDLLNNYRVALVDLLRR